MRRGGPDRVDGAGPFASTAGLLAGSRRPVSTPTSSKSRGARRSLPAGITLPMMIDDPDDTVISTPPCDRRPRRWSDARTAAETTEDRDPDVGRRHGRPALAVGPSREQEAAAIAAWQARLA